MRASFEWLCDLAGITELAPRQAAEALTMVGLNVEDLTVIDYTGIVVGRIAEQEPHPKSRKPLWIHQVDVGGEVRQIIAGAPNAVPGSLVAVALPGTTVPGGVTVRDGKIAGYDARGMLCSAEELALSDDGAGIMLLAAGTPGQPFSEIVPNDAILDIEVSPNRPDCLGHLGLARELAAALGRPLGRDFMPLFTGGVEPRGVDLIRATIEEPDLCSRYIAAVVSNITVGPSPAWMQRRLRAAGVRPINNVVDVTNYVQLEYGQPLHTFDMEKIAGAEIRVRLARPGERLLCLDGQDRELTPDVLVIADAERPIALAGLIGGEDSGVSERTTSVVLEAACFDGVRTRATSRLLRLRTEASGRFEKGLSPELALAGARRAATLLGALAGGRVHVDWVDEYPRPQEPARIRFRPERVDALLGTHIPLDEMEAIFKRLEFQVRGQDEGGWDAMPPVYRLDVRIEADLVEEVGRMHGYDRIPPTLPGRRRERWHTYRPSRDKVLDAARHALAAAGYTETVGVALVPSRRLETLRLTERAMRVVNPISDEHDVLRTSLLATLLQTASLNQRRSRAAVSVFEIGRAYLRRDEGPDELPEEPTRLGILRATGAGAEEGRAAFLHVKGAFEAAVRALGPRQVGYDPEAASPFHPGRCARVAVGGEAAGWLGEVHPAVLAQLDLPGRVVALEVDVAALLAGGDERRYVPLPRFPSVDRDLAVVVGADVPAVLLRQTIEGAGGELLASARAFDEYRGGQVGEGRKSVAFALTFRSPDRTLTDGEVDSTLDAVRGALRRDHAADFRS
jgi:phenylalanyl-tRNA synthetase beta chain